MTNKALKSSNEQKIISYRPMKSMGAIILAPYLFKYQMQICEELKFSKLTFLSKKTKYDIEIEFELCKKALDNAVDQSVLQTDINEDTSSIIIESNANSDFEL
jgi:hypothetical protein